MQGKKRPRSNIPFPPTQAHKNKVKYTRKGRDAKEWEEEVPKRPDVLRVTLSIGPDLDEHRYDFLDIDWPE